jgi:hypothetical protein
MEGYAADGSNRCFVYRTGGKYTCIGLRKGCFSCNITFGYMISIDFWAKPLVTNKIVLITKHNI